MRTAHSSTIMDLNGTPRAMVLSAGILDKRHRASYSSIASQEFELGDGKRCSSSAFDEGPVSDLPQDRAGEVTYDVGDILPGRLKTVEYIYRVQ